jgi:ubiquinone/menaquinone biosynthesis C-methylase UbiE
VNNKQQLEQERLEHNAIYADQGERLLEQSLSWDDYYQQMCIPPHKGGTLYGLDHKIFFDFLLKSLKDTPKNEIRILDYGCGTGVMGIALATLGFPVAGFDLSDAGIEVAKTAAKKVKVDQQTEFVVANAQQLPFADNSFDLVIGKAVLHHVIKYEGCGQELHRIMKSGARAVFLEGAAGNPLIAQARKFTIQEELGDVPLTSSNINSFATDFETVDIKGYFFLYMLKRFGYYASDETLPDRGKNRFGRTAAFRFMLKVGLFFDRLLVNEKVLALAGRYLIILKK